jgi:hypothetical protein
MLKHLPRCLKYGGVRLHRDNGGGHDIFGFHDSSPIFKK